MKQATVLLTCIAVFVIATSASRAALPQATRRTALPNTINQSKHKSPVAGTGLSPGNPFKTPSDNDPAAEAQYRELMKPEERSLNTARQLYQEGHLAAAEKAAQETIQMATGLSSIPYTESWKLIGQIRMQQGRYQEALDWFRAYWQPNGDELTDLDVALCYSRLGLPAMAAKFYSDNAILRYTQTTPDDLPGTTDPQSLEASILMARGLHFSLTSTGAHLALGDFIAAGKLAPHNGAIAYYTAKTLLDLRRRDDAKAYLLKAAQNGKGSWMREVTELLAGYPRK